MPKVVADITMSLDGFVTGPDPDLMHGLGHGADALHTRVFSSDEVDLAVLAERVGRAGTALMSWVGTPST